MTTLEIQERILVYGGSGSGKSRGWLTLARQFPDSRFFCIDTDKAIARMLALGFKNLKNVIVYPARNWAQCEAALVGIQQQKPTEQDWIVVDMIDSTWDFVQADFVEQIFGKKIDDYFMEVRKAAGKGASKLEVFEGWIDWNVINKKYQDWANTICYDLPCHVYLTAKATNLGKKDDATIREIYTAIGAKPEGEKRNTYRVNTVLFLSHSLNDYYATTAKDRERPRLRNVKVKDFAQLYMSIIDGSYQEQQNIENDKADFKQWMADNSISASDVLAKLGVESFGDIKDFNKAKEVLTGKKND